MVRMSIGVRCGPTGSDRTSRPALAVADRLAAELAKTAGHAGFGRRHHAAFARGHVLRCVEAEDGEISPGPDRPAIESGHMRLGGILDEEQTVACGDGSQLVERGRMT